MPSEPAKPAEPSKPLTAKQKRFVVEYAADPVAVQAYMRAFGRYTSTGKLRTYRSAQVESSKLLSNPIIQAELEAANLAYERSVRVSKLRVIREVAAIAFADADDLYEPDDQNNGLPRPRPWRDVPPAVRRTVQSVRVKRRKYKDDAGDLWETEEIEYRQHSKTQALDRLCRRLGLYTTDEDLKALVKLAAAQGEQIAELTRRVRAAEQAAAGVRGAGPGVGGAEPVGPRPPG